MKTFGTVLWPVFSEKKKLETLHLESNPDSAGSIRYRKQVPCECFWTMYLTTKTQPRKITGQEILDERTLLHIVQLQGVEGHVQAVEQLLHSVAIRTCRLGKDGHLHNKVMQ